MNPMDLRRGINIAVEAVVRDLKSRAKMISTTEEIAQARQLMLGSAPEDSVRCHMAGFCRMPSYNADLV